jgi:Reverse transcriptase (RNA-dependent DNA polymerase)/Endonuclease-reverse transcriptase
VHLRLVLLSVFRMASRSELTCCVCRPKDSLSNCACTHVVKDTGKNSTCMACNETIQHVDEVDHSTVKDSWLCARCLIDIFPFNHIVENDVFLRCITDTNLNSTLNSVLNEELRLEIFPEESDNRTLLNNADIDPDQNYFSNISWDSSYHTPQSLKPKFTPNSLPFSIMHLNCRSMLYKLDEIRSLLDQLPVSVLALSETWLDARWEEDINIVGYQWVHRPRGDGKGGGVGFLVKEGIAFQPIQLSTRNIVYNSFEELIISVKLKRGTCIMGVIYKPPGKKLDEFNLEMDSLLSEISTKGKDVIMLGDFNVDLLKINEHKGTDSFYNCLTAHHLLPVITRPTRITPNSATLIDNIFTNAWAKIIDSSIIASDISDHLPILARFDFEMTRVGNSLCYDQRLVNDERREAFGSNLSSLDWTPVLKACAEGEANRAYDLFMQMYKSAYDKAFPFSKKMNKSRSNYKQPWMTRGLLKSSKKKSLLYLKYLKNPIPNNKSKFVAYRNKFKTIRIKAERNYYAAEFCKYENDLKRTWGLIRSIMKMGEQESKIDSLKINGDRIDAAEMMANKFNNYFTSIAQSLAEKIPDSPHSFKRYLQPPRPNSFALAPTSPEEILNRSRSIRTTHSSGVDDIDPCIATLFISNVSLPLAELINCSFNTGIVPQAIKIAKVVPIYKKGEKDNITNYRPISILPYFSKYYEKIMYDRLYKFIEKSNIIFHTQHGFQSGHSPYMSLLNMQDKISNAIENNEYAVGIFFDLAKAFDTVDHAILLNKLATYGIRGMQLDWFASYFENRLQRVLCNGALSDLRAIKYGVPQGSNLGPLLFLLYINDLPNASPTLFFILFADDTNVFYSHRSLQSLTEIVNTELSSVADWFCVNKLTLNLDKTNFILFKSHRKVGTLDNQMLLRINEDSIAQVKTTKFLGVYVDQHMTWNEHIKNISNKIAKNIGILARASYLLPYHIRLKLYYSLIYPYLTYCNIVWASTYSTRLQRLVTLQKRAIRIIAGVHSCEHTSPIFSALKLLNIEQIKILQVGEFMYRYDHGLLPPAFSDFFHQGTEIHSHFTRNASSYRPVYAHTNTRLFSIKSAGTTIWNKFPSHIRVASNLLLFKKMLRTFLTD